MQLRYYQQDGIDSFWDFMCSGEPGHPLLCFPTGCHAKGHPILMFDGSIKPVEDVLVGDRLMGPDSKPREVLALARGRQEMRRIVPTKGEPFAVNLDHKLSLKRVAQRKVPKYDYEREGIETVTVREYEKGNTTFKHVRKLRRVAVEFDNREPVPFDPYLLGLLLGDGSVKYGTVGITTMDSEIVEYCETVAKQYGLSLTCQNKPNSLASTYTFSGCKGAKNPVTEILKTLDVMGKGSDNKSVPPVYKTADRDTRLKLIAGMVDSDGSYDSKSNIYDWSSISEKMADDFVFLCRSVGLAAYKKVKPAVLNGRYICDSYRVCVSGDIDSIPVLVEHRKAKPREQKKDVLCTGFKIEKLPEDDYYGFTLDGDKLYLDANFVVHHNTGKSVILAGCIQKVLSAYRKTRILALVHVKELVEQNHKKFKAFCADIDDGIYSAGLGEKETAAQVIFGGVASVVKAIDKMGVFHLVFVDEAHMISPSEKTMYLKIINAIKAKNPSVRVVGLTATPWRAGMGRIDEGEDALFTKTVCDWTTMEKFNQLLNDGFLCPLIPFKTDLILDVDNVGTARGDFKQDELEAAVNRDEITDAAIEECLQFKEDRKSWLVFGAGVEHCLRIEEMLNAKGISARAVWSSRKVKEIDQKTGLQVLDPKTGKAKYKTVTMPDGERDKIIADFKAGKFQAIVSNGILTTGFDHPPVDMIVMLRPTKSIVLWIQMLGRGTRPYDPDNAGDGIDIGFFNVYKFNTLVMDFAGNTKRLGQINDPYIPKKRGKGGGSAPVKECPVCNNYVPAPARECPGMFPSGAFCDHVFVFDTKIDSVASSEDLIKGDMPIVETFKIDRIEYAPHQTQKGKSMKISYFCGRKIFREFVCLEYEGGAKVLAQRWIRDNVVDGHMTMTDYSTVNSLLAIATTDKIKTPTHIRVHTNNKYPKILARCFDGTGFGTEAEPCSAPSVDSFPDLFENILQQHSQPAITYDEDIPF